MFNMMLRTFSSDTEVLIFIGRTLYPRSHKLVPLINLVPEAQHLLFVNVYYTLRLIGRKTMHIDLTLIEP